MKMTLPTEIMSHIDNYLCSNKERLICLRVCSQWHHLFERSLYRSVRIKDKAQFEKFYKRCVSVGHLVRLLDLSQLPSIKGFDLPRVCPNIRTLSLHPNLRNELLINTVTKLSLHSLSTLNLHSSMANRILENLSGTLTELTVSVCFPLERYFHPIRQLESLLIHIHPHSTYGITFADLEYIHDCFPNLRKICIDGNASFTKGEPILLTTIQPSKTMKSFKSNQRMMYNCIDYIYLKYPLLETLELEVAIPDSVSTVYPWYKLVLNCTYLQRLSLIGFTPDQKFFTSLLKCPSLKVLRLGTVLMAHSGIQQAPVIPISEILKQYRNSLEELLFWPCHIIHPLTDLIHPNLALCHRLKRLSLSGIHLLLCGGDTVLDIPLDVMLAYGVHLRHLNIEYATLSYHAGSSKNSTTPLRQISLHHVGLSEHVMDYLRETCPRLTDISLSHCQFPINHTYIHTLR